MRKTTRWRHDVEAESEGSPGEHADAFIWKNRERNDEQLAEQKKDAAGTDSAAAS
jgi:hypothetical protein